MYVVLRRHLKSNFPFVDKNRIAIIGSVSTHSAVLRVFVVLRKLASFTVVT